MTPRPRISTVATSAALLPLVVVLAACSGSHATTSTASPSVAQASQSSPAAPTGSAPAAATRSSAPAAAYGAGKSIVVIGNSGATGYNADEGTPDAASRQNSADGREDSWATGTNAAVDSIYQRLAAKSPAYAGHQFNLAADGAKVADMIGQADYLTEVKPAPAAVFVEGVDDDMKCDGTDSQNYAPFGASFTTLLQTIDKNAPNAQIYLLSVWTDVADYTNAIAVLPSVKASNEDGSPCAPFDASGKQLPAGIAYAQDVTDHYDHELGVACAAFPNCHYDNGAMQHLAISSTDLTSDGAHLNVTGLRKYADLVWSTFFAGQAG